MKEALKLALEALEMVKANADDWQERTGKEIKGWMQPVNNSITTIKEALAQPEQEPVAWMGAHDPTDLYHRKPPQADVVPLYTTPPQRKPLTDERIADIVIEMNGNEPTALFWRDLAQAIEAAHGIKE